MPVIFTVWKNETLTLTKKIFRQINSLVINRYFHEIFAKNACVRVKLQCAHCGVSEIFVSLMIFFVKTIFISP